MQIEVTEREFSQHAEDYDGVCLSCGEWGDGGVEPDAEGYTCEACGANDVVGAEQAMLLGHIVFTEEEERSDEG